MGCLLKLLCHGPEPESDRTGLASPPADAATPIDPLDMLASRARLAPDDQPRITISPFFPAPALAPTRATPTQLANGSSATSASAPASAPCSHIADASRNAGGTTTGTSSLVSSTSGALSSSSGAGAGVSSAELNRGGS